MGDAAGGWIAYAILVIQGLVYLVFLLVLFAKVLEGLVRLVWDVSFDRSKHTVDTGLIGAIGLAPCCGRRARHSRASASPTPSHARGTMRTRRGESDSTRTMLPPVASQSHTTVPSVLRPEQLNQPYREESDDEGGYILGAWHYDDEPSPDGAGANAGANAGAGGRAATPPTPPTPPAPDAPSAAGSGFSRVAGGRANLESPFTMSGPGATAPGPFPQTRGQSQSGISGDAPEGHAGSSGHSAQRTGGSSEIAGGASHGEDFPRMGRRRRWLGLFAFAAREEQGQAHARGRRGKGSAEDAGAPMLHPLADEAASSSASASQASPGPASASARTFVVIRDRRPSLRPSPLSQTHTHVPDAGSSDVDVVRARRTASPLAGPATFSPDAP